jgi:hypothetical protein
MGAADLAREIQCHRGFDMGHFWFGSGRGWAPLVPRDGAGLECPSDSALTRGLVEGPRGHPGETAKPCLRTFWAERAFPSGVRGPVDLAALAGPGGTPAASCFSDVLSLAM